jgi:5-methylcytosine-specific restriction endonuclease McrA
MFDDKDADRAADGLVPGAVPLERLEAQLCEVAGHLTAATCRFLVLLGEFDERRGWASWEMSSCAAWLSWKCQMSSGTAREHVRVARALRELPVIQAEFAAARLSYVKVRALTRIATPVTEAGLAEIAGPMTGNQLERFARAHRQCSRADDAAARVRRRLTWRFEEDGSLAGTFRLPPLQGAVLLKALRAAIGRPERPGEDGDGPSGPAGVSAETPPPAPGDPADPARGHVEDGAALSVTTAQMIGCSAALSWLLHGAGGRVLDLGRRRRRPNAALRKAARERDHGRCRYPGCESRKVDLHHIQYWSNGGRTSLDNLISLCKRHHMAVHDRGYLIAARDDATFAFCQPDGTPVPSSPALPAPVGDLAEVHDAEITPETIIPPWYGERLDLDYAISTCLANERIRADRAAGRDASVTADPVFVPKPCLDPYCQSCFSWPRPSAPIRIPIPV